MNRWISMMFTAISLIVAMQASACDLTLDDGGDLAAAVASASGKKICLRPGVYVTGPTPLEVPDGTTIEGLGASMADVLIYAYGSPQKAIGLGSNTMLHNFTLSTTAGGNFGVLAYHREHVIIWSLDILGFQISAGVVGGKSVDIWDTFMRSNGIAGNNVADPNLWITDSRDVTLLYGQLTGRKDGPGGDGEMAIYNSSNVMIDGARVIDSGASAIYLVNCVDCTLKNSVIERPGEWGIDVVQGSHRFLAENNSVSGANYGGAVFETAGGATATFRSNRFIQNRRLGVGNCNGINAKGSVAGVVSTGNTSLPSGDLCSFP
ncbi:MULTISPECIES: right-handed parallel beta-helix repeat-containing protein [Stenotrophomonas]|uniref:right-handed parallel beta-helix repeat-containing protein n=1 Tax=Stenotrophomonas pavanii TaxID=487698 RepID=UPI0012AFE3AF|nr:right-handed parallel beta-helix repeat-containing protein [Stenotrophomonas maltophilia]MBN7839654.1 right-handed parallel beta-helix repeat-containing protein [Stenotrophomonas maltophilia]QGL97556.1 right-handed parallel beta-helix repeat-containing protein [Stenotrophomonas maltophilia]